ncbi:MAG: hypothetical protein WBP81_01805, partial [Solirubrobacteraceae bacterium]
MNDTDVDELRSVDYLVAELAGATCSETPSGRANRRGRRYGRSRHPAVCAVVGIGGRTGAMTFET